MSVYKGKKLALSQDLFQFLVRAMKQLREREVVITVHSIVPAPESIWKFLEKLDDEFLG